MQHGFSSPLSVECRRVLISFAVTVGSSPQSPHGRYVRWVGVSPRCIRGTNATIAKAIVANPANASERLAFQTVPGL